MFSRMKFFNFNWVWRSATPESAYHVGDFLYSEIPDLVVSNNLIYTGNVGLSLKNIKLNNRKIRVSIKTVDTKCEKVN